MRTNPLVLIALTSLAVACESLASIPFSIDLVLDVPALDAEAVEADGDGWRAIVATDVQDLDEARDELPKGVGGVSVDALVIDSPMEGPLGQWLEGFDLYASTDGVLSDDDVLVASYGDLDPATEQLVVPVDDSVSPLLDGASIALVLDARLRELPSEPLRFPVEVEANALIVPF